VLLVGHVLGHREEGLEARLGDAVQLARRSLIAERRPIGLVLVSHGEPVVGDGRAALARAIG